MVEEKENILVAFSGGRTSAFMCHWLINNMSHIYNLKFVYANTGLEHEKTLDFVDKVDKYFNLNLVWVEALINKKQGKGTDFKIVNFKNCTRNGELFDDMCSVYGLMNGTYIHCTRELKNIPMKKYADTIFKQYRIALGIRYDEFSRVKNRKDAIYPLATISKTTKQEVLEFWKKQPFDLNLEEHYGNCVACYKKSDKKLKMIANENPHYFETFIELEKKYSFVKTKEELGERIIYRNFRTAYQVQNNINLPENILNLDECAEECGSVFIDFESQKPKDMILSKGLFDDSK